MRKPPPIQKPIRKPRKRTPAQEELFGTGNPNPDKVPELGREIAKLRRDYSEIELSHLRVARGY